MSRLAMFTVSALSTLFPCVSRGQSAGMLLADSLFAAKQWSGAAAAYESVAQADSQNVRALIRLGISFRHAGELEAAQDVFDELLAQGSGMASLLYLQKAMAYAAGERRDDALTALEQASGRGLSDTNALDAEPVFDPIRREARFEAVRADVDRRARPCAYEEGYDDFDFWVGSWDVYMIGGALAGRNEISKTQSSCLVLEKWTGQGGGTGTSMNFYDPHAGTWTQQWVSASGTLIRIEGGVKDDSMVLTGDIRYAGGDVAPFRGTWTLLEDGRVRQFFEQMDPETETWNPWFEGFYVRSE